MKVTLTIEAESILSTEIQMVAHINQIPTFGATDKAFDSIYNAIDRVVRSTKRALDENRTPTLLPVGSEAAYPTPNVGTASVTIPPAPETRVHWFNDEEAKHHEIGGNH